MSLRGGLRHEVSKSRRSNLLISLEIASGGQPAPERPRNDEVFDL